MERTEETFFSCDMCGLCCRQTDKVPELASYHYGNGICKFLDEATNRCTIYENRPIICNVEAAYHAYFSENYTIEEYLRLNYEACNRLKKGK